MKKILWMCVAASLLVLPACDKKEDAKGEDAKAEAPAGEEGAAAKEEPKEEAKGMTPEAFAAAAPANICSWIDTCKNQEVTTGVNAMMTMVAAFGSMAKPEVQAKLKPVTEAMEKDKRTMPTKDECGVIAGISAELMGFDAATLKKNVDAKKVKFDGVKAAACAQALKGELEACKTEKKVEGDVKLSQMDAMMKPYEAALESHMKPCEDMIEGTVAAGETCEQDYVCAKGTKCQSEKPGDAAKKCIAVPGADAPADGAAKDGEAPAK